jgi:histidyl-tRNA synthetase
LNKICLNCDQEFISNSSSQKYCSKCKENVYYNNRVDKWRKKFPLLNKICPECKKEFIPMLSNTQRYCSQKCMRRFSSQGRSEKSKLQILAHKKEVHKKIIKEIKELLGNDCFNPYSINHSSFREHYLYLKILQIDHINGNGCAERKKSRNLKYYNDILKAIKLGSKDYQLLCPTCNWMKRYVNNEDKRNKT